MRWLVNHRWWTLAGACVLLLLGLVLRRSVLTVIPLGAVLFLLFFASLMALVKPGGGQGPRGPH